MKWVTRKRIHVNRTATAWLIRRFLDPAAEILFVEPDEVAALQDRESAIGFDAPGTRYPHQDNRGSARSGSSSTSTSRAIARSTSRAHRSRRRFSEGDRRHTGISR